MSLWVVTMHMRDPDVLLERAVVEAPTWKEAVAIVRERNLPRSKYQPAFGHELNPEHVCVSCGADASEADLHFINGGLIHLACRGDD